MHIAAAEERNDKLYNGLFENSYNTVESGQNIQNIKMILNIC